MIRTSFLVAVVIAALPIVAFSASERPTGLTACNKTKADVRVALAADCNYSISGCHPPEMPWSQGWWTIEPGACKTLFTYPLSGLGDVNYYYYAEGSSLGPWMGKTSFCVDGNRQFEFHADENTKPCKAGAVSRRFKRLAVPVNDLPDLDSYSFTIT